MSKAKQIVASTNTTNQVFDDNLELSSFKQNINTLEKIIGKMEVDVFSDAPNVDRLTIYQSEVQSILGEIQAQQTRALAENGAIDSEVQRLQFLLSTRLTPVVNKVDGLLNESQTKLASLNQQMTYLESIAPANFTLEMQEGRSTYGEENLESLSSIGSNDELTKALVEITQSLGKTIASQPDTKEHYLPILEQLLKLSLGKIMANVDIGGVPPRGPVDTPKERGDDGGMEPRIANLEKFADECRKDLRSIDVRLGKIETSVDGIARTMATRADIADVKGSISQMETTILKWFVTTAIALTGLAFAAAKLLG